MYPGTCEPCSLFQRPALLVCSGKMLAHNSLPVFKSFFNSWRFMLYCTQLLCQVQYNASFLISNRHFQTQYFKFPPLTTKKHMPTHANQGVNLSLSLSLDLSIYLSIYVSAVLLIQRGCLERYGLSQFKDLGETWILSPKVTSRAIHEQVVSRANRASHKRGTWGKFRRWKRTPVALT